MRLPKSRPRIAGIESWRPVRSNWWMKAHAGLWLGRQAFRMEDS